MNVNEVAPYLGCSGEQVKTLITDGMALPKSGTVVKLLATVSGKHVDITEQQLDEYIKRFEDEEPGRHPPTAVCRELLTEARHHCAICGEAHPLEFHHMVDWATLPHHDPKQMLAICGSCHTKCTNGMIDHKSQLIYKGNLKKPIADPDQVLKVAKDKKAIEEIFAAFPSRFIEIFLEEAKSDKYWYDLPIHLDGLSIAVNSPLFYLYDIELWQLLKDFFAFWNSATLTGSVLFYDSNRMGVAYLDPNVNDNEVSRSKYERYRKLVQETRRTLALMQAHIRERYPDIDLDALGHQASNDAQRRAAEVKEKMRQGG